MGIKGAAMANTARMLHQRGYVIFGWDTKESFITDTVLATFPYSMVGETLPENIDLAIYSAAHGGKNHPLMQQADKRGITIMHQVELMAQIEGACTHRLAVAGCHGKTTTSALLSYVLTQLKQHPSYIVGVSQFMDQYGGNFDGTDYFVFEADEYGIQPPEDKTPKFLKFNPTHAIITNIDYDHPDMYQSINDVKKAFDRFMKKIVENGGKLVFCGENEHLSSIINSYPQGQVVRYGFTKQCDYVVSQIVVGTDATKFSVNGHPFSIKLFGEKNALNAAAVIALLHMFGFSFEDIATAIKAFSGAKRRFELVYEHAGSYLFDDYAHHPAEIRATIQAARNRFPQKKHIIVFQPHTYSRTVALADDFVHALELADYAYVLPIFGSARERVETADITTEELVTRSKKGNLAYATKENVVDKLRKQFSDDERVIITMGAGDVYHLGKNIARIM